MTPQQLAEMTVLQDRLNARVNPEWRTAGYPWGRAIFMECAELMDHTPWKWWKAGTASPLEQQQLEVVDIWHFLLSAAIVLCKSPEEAADDLAVAWKAEPSNRDWLSTQAVIEKFAASAVYNALPAIREFRELMARVGLTDDQLHRMYLAKNVLNFFRAEHGYAEGTYVKHWHGAEDNEVLANIMATSLTPTYDSIYERLEAAYPKA